MSSIVLCQETQYPAGIIYGPKAAFQINAPDGWVLDNKSGAADGLDCVLYLKGLTWENSPVVMYAKIAGTKFEDVGKFIDFAIRSFQQEDSNFIYARQKNRAINKKDSAIVYDYIGGPYHEYDRAAYIQVPKAVCYIVFSAHNKDDFEKYAPALLKTADSFVYMPQYIRP